MAELVPGGEKDSVVYLGKSSFKMKVGVRMTPPAEATATMPPSPRVLQTPRPTLGTPRVPSTQSGSHSRQQVVAPAPAPDSQLVHGIALAKSTLVGLCLTAFSCGIMCTVAIDRYWPRARTECVGAQPGTTHAAAPTGPVIEAPARPASANAPSGADVVSLPPYGEKLPTADKVIAVEAAAVAPAAVAPPSPATRTTAPVRLAPSQAQAQGRSVVRKRPAPATVTAEKSSASPTETWTDPFAE